MSKKSTKATPRVVKSRDEVLAELRKSADWMKKMAFTKNVFFPAVIQSSNSIEDATQFLSSISTTIMQEFLVLMKDKKFSELKLHEKLDKDNPKYDELVKLLALFNDESVYDARTLFEGMNNEIKLFVSHELSERPLSSLKVRWLDEEDASK